MAIIKENDLTEGMSGKFGRKIIFRVVKGVTVAARRSTQQRVPSAKQLAQQDRFQSATQYARSKMLDPIAKQQYKDMAGDEAFNTPFTAAVKDYMVSPVIKSIDVSTFTGAQGSIIPIKVSNNLKTIQITVSVILADTTVVESGEATFTTGDADWKYTTMQVLPTLVGSKVVVTAIDRPGNATIQEKLLG